MRRSPRQRGRSRRASGPDSPALRENRGGAEALFRSAGQRLADAAGRIVNRQKIALVWVQQIHRDPLVLRDRRIGAVNADIIERWQDEVAGFFHFDRARSAWTVETNLLEILSNFL